MTLQTEQGSVDSPSGRPERRGDSFIRLGSRVTAAYLLFCSQEK